ncbi:endosome-associated-trafficking regulator 1 isoform X2 [Anoplopoma fimbria]|uniref:endosome-associated-trafficking regulator 1 isoform X2 n=1 Tax=Anoplopoma fimbria TaxID=229290 RepID=UPI0023ECB50F|nr:endosome-associated-trafficking regulator 1 isoform X2 [Anoplopoma fimbria]
MSRHKSLIITDDEQLESEDLNPFSFREFLRWKNQDQDPEQDLDQEQTHSGVLQREPEEEEEEDTSVTFDPEVRSCFFSEPSLAPQEQEEGWGRSFQSGVESTSSLCTEEEEEEEEEETRFSSRPEVQQGGAGGAGGGENYEGDDETSMAEAVTSCRRRSSRSSQIQQLKEENLSLRRSMMELQRRSEANEHRVAQLSEELVRRRCQEEKEAQDLECMVHSVEQNLHLMTKRALKAEGCVSKLKVELQQLQGEVDTLRSENNSLKAAESETVMTMRHNAQVASEYLNKTASHAHSSIRQLLGEAETLCLVSQLLQSIDKISNLDSES